MPAHTINRLCQTRLFAQNKPATLKRTLSAACAAMSLCFAHNALAADPVPSLIKVLVGYPPGAGTDSLGRIYADALAKELGVNVVVENRPGAGGQIAAVALKNAPADGSTLMMAMDHQIVMLAHTMANPGFDGLKDFSPIVQAASYSVCIAVNPEVQATNVQEWAEQVRANPEIGNIGVPALGSNAHFMGDVLSEHLNVDVNVVPYRGAAPLITDVIGGHVDTIIMPCGDPLVRNHEAAKLRVIGVASKERLPNLPQVPSLEELGIDSPSDYFLGVYAPSTVTGETLQKLREASMHALSAPGMQEKLATTGLIPTVHDARTLETIAHRSFDVWGERIKKSGFQPQ